MTSRGTAPGSAEMTAMVLRTDRSIGLERRPVLTLRDNQVLVAIDLCGLRKRPALPSHIMGHEPVGQPRMLSGAFPLGRSRVPLSA